MTGPIVDAVRRWLLAEGSTRAVGLMRILFPLIAWARFADELLPFRDQSPERLALSLAFFASTTWMLIGWQARTGTAACAATLVSMVYGLGRNGGVEPWTHHHTTVLADAVVLLALTPNGGSFSLDRWLEVRDARRAGRPPPPERGALWAVPLIGLLVASVYFWSAVDKTTIGFLTGQRLEQIWVAIWWGSDWPDRPGFRALFAAMAVVVVALEYLLPFGLWSRRLQPWLIPIGITLHALFYTLLPVGTFSVTMVACYLAFLDPQVVHRVIDELLGAARDGDPPSVG